MLIYIHYVCLACRRCAKRQSLSCYEEYASLRCAQCKAEMICVGKHFTAPPRRADKQWEKLAWMIENGWSGDNWPVSPDMNLNQVRESLRANREAHSARVKRVRDEISFEQARRNARWNFRRSRAARRREQLELKAQQKYQDAVLARVNKPS